MRSIWRIVVEFRRRSGSASSGRTANHRPGDTTGPRRLPVDDLPPARTPSRGLCPRAIGWDLFPLAEAVLALLVVALPAPSGAEPSLRERLEAEVDRFSGQLDGVVLVARQDEILLERALGLRDGRTGLPNLPTTLFRVGSITKQFTAATVLSLAEEGRLKLDAPLSEYLPDYPRANLVREGRQVTLEHLLHHTSGVVRAEQLPAVRERMWSQPISASIFLQAVMEQPLETSPGQTFRYSNTGYMLLGEVVRRVTGDSFEAALRARLLEPLGMRDTGITPSPEQAERLARGRFPFLNGWVDSVDTFRLREPNLNEVRTSGALFSSTRDMVRWAQVFIDPARGPMRPSSIAEMMTPDKEDYGHGVVVDGSGPWRRVWHNGAISPLGFSSELAVFPAQGLVVVVLSNDDVSLGTAARLRKNLVAVLKGESPTQPAAAPRSARLAAAFMGGLSFASRGWGRFLLPAITLTWTLLAARRRGSSVLDWLEHVLAPLALWGLSLGPILDGPAGQVLTWGGASLISLTGLLLCRRVRGLPWAHRTRAAHFWRIVLSALPALGVGFAFGSDRVLRVLLCWLGLGVAIASRRPTVAAKPAAT